MKTIFAIVHSQTIRQLLLRHLGSRYSLQLCSCLEEAAQLLQESPDGLILELFLPGGGTLEFLEDRAFCLPPAVMGLSYLADRSVLDTFSTLGVHSLIRLPATGPHIARQLELLLDKKDPSLSGGEGLSENCSV